MEESQKPKNSQIDAPACIHCGDTKNMVLENHNGYTKHWHCKSCLSKTVKTTMLGHTKNAMVGIGSLLTVLVMISGGNHK